MRTLSILILVSATSLLTLGCGDDAGGFGGSGGDGGSGGSGGDGGSGGSSTCEFDSTFAAIQANIFEAKGCTNAACHGQDEENAPGNLDLREGNSLAGLLRVDATVGNPSGAAQRVFPGDEERSVLWLKLAAKTRPTEVSLGDFGVGGGAMPANDEVLSEEELEALRKWIRGGAQGTGLTEGTEAVLKCDGPIEPTPNKIEPLTLPDPSQGVQFYSGAWDLGAEAEDEVCFATYYNFADIIPVAQQFDCEDQFGGVGRKCFAYGRNELAQDGQSHHSIINVYTTKSDPLSDDWGGLDAWTCAGGTTDGDPCNPTVAGACGARGQCATRRITSVACVGYGPSPQDFSFSPSGQGGNSTVGLAGAQESTAIDVPYQGVYTVLPVDGFISWNSHAFNLTRQDTTIEQWVNVDYVAPEDREWPRRQIFRAENIFAMGRVAPFTEREICMTWTLPQYSRLMSISSHMHKRGKRFRIWLPPNESCGAGVNGCSPATREADYVSFVYDDPVYNYYDPLDAAMVTMFDSTDTDNRTFRACAVYDNGANDPGEVKRHSTRPNSAVCNSPVPFANCGCEPSERFCYGGPSAGAPCGGDDGACGEGGLCDACELRGGITTDDEMFIPLGTYFVQSP